MKEADKDFQKAIWDREYSNCYPLYYLGMIKLKAGDWAFLREFSDSIGCLEERMIMIENRVKEIEIMELGEREKEWMRQDRRKKLEEFKKSSQQLIQQMNAIIEKNRDKKKAFDEQVKNKALSRVKALLERDPGQLNKLDKEGSTLLHKAIENGQQAVSEFLVARGARLDIANSIGYKPLHWAVMIGQKEIIERLIRKGAKVDAAARDGMTPLHDAAHGGNKEIIRLLLAAGADPYARTFKGKTPLDLAVEQGKHEVFDLLKPIHTAAEKGDIAKVKGMLREKPGLIDARDEDHKTPLSLAAANGHKELAWFLVNNGADINARDIDGYTPLMRAQQKNHQRIARMLLVKGADITDEDILKKQLPEKEAIVWYLNGHGWAVKTKSSFLIFDYSTMHQYRYRQRGPSKPFLSNGHINPSQIGDQQVYVFVSNKRVNHRDPDLVLGWEKTIPGIKYIFGWPALAGPAYTIMEGRQKKEINSMEIVTIKATGDGVGFLVKVDGLAIFYPGDHRYFGEDRWEAFTQEVDYLAQTGRVVDIAFLPMAGDDYPGKDNLKKGTGYILEKLQPKVTFLLPFGMGELPIKEFARELGKKGIESIIHAANSRGDRFVVNNQ
jgi:ankyrin repeat protein